MSYTVPVHHVQQFGRNVMHLAQQKGSRLRGAVYEEAITGDRAYIDQLGTIEAVELTSRHGDTPFTPGVHSRRRITSTPAAASEILDREDKVRTIHELTSPYAMAIANGIGRRIDRKIIKAAFATAYTGQDGTTTVAFPASNVVAVDSWTYEAGVGNVGLTVSKLIEAKVGLDAAETDPEEPRFIACKAKQIGNLLGTTKATSTDYAAVKALVNGEINTFMGFTFIRTELIEDDGSGYSRVIAWVKSGLGLGIAEEIYPRIDELPTKNYSTQVYARQDCGAARLEEAKVWEIKCA